MSDRTTPPIVLASASPRRKQLLAQAGYVFIVVPSQIGESSFPTEGFGPIDYAKTLALAKARDVAGAYPGHLVIGADTIADLAGRIVGKPQDEQNAERIIRALFAAPHRVITGLALVRRSDNTELSDADVTTVYPRKLTGQQIREHIAGGAWRGKSGAYAIRENDEFVERIEGSLTNVMGLPTELLGRMLAAVL